MQNVQNSQTSPLQTNGNISGQTLDIGSVNGAQGESPQEVNRSITMINASAFLGAGAGGFMGLALTNGLRLVVHGPYSEWVYLLYIPCVACSALGFRLLANHLVKKQEEERATNREEDRYALSSGMSSAPDQRRGLLSPDIAAQFVVVSELVHAGEPFSQAGSEVHSAVTYSVVGVKHADAEVCQDNAITVSDQSSSPAGPEVHLTVSTYNDVGNDAEACKDNETANGGVLHLARMFSDSISTNKKNFATTTKPDFSYNSSQRSGSVRLLVEKLQGVGVEAPNANSNSR